MTQLSYVASNQVRSIYHALLLSIIAAFTLSGCAVSVPVHDAYYPHTMGNNGFRLGFTEAGNPVVGPDLGKYGLLDRAVDTETDVSLIGYSLAYGITEQLDIEVESLANFSSGGTTVFALKYQWLGESLFKATRGQWIGTTRVKYISSSGYKQDPAKYGNGDDDDDDDDLFDINDLFFEKLEGKGYGIQQVFGYHVLDWFVLNAGLNYHTFKVDSRFRDGGPSGPLYSDSRTVDLYGVYAGFCLLPRWSRFAFHLCSEWGAQRTEKAFENNKNRAVATRSASLGLNFKF